MPDHRHAPWGVVRRMDSFAATLRRLNSELRGGARYVAQPNGEKYLESHEPATGEHRERLLAEIDSTVEELSYWEGVHMAQVELGVS